jgi:pimeloyl-ACP methyl ester carboxylesterase
MTAPTHLPLLLLPGMDGTDALLGPIARALAIRGVDVQTELRALRQPVLYLQSARDRVVGPHNLARIRALRPDTEVATLPGDHFALFPEAALAAAAIRRFLQAHAMP